MERNCQQEYVEDQQIISEENEENDGFEQIISENESEETIISEVHSNLNEIEPKTANGEFKTEFIFQFPNDNLKFEVKLEYDENGDLILPRKSHFPQTSPCKLTFFHLNQTSLENVGMQIWKGALLLSDFLIYKSELFKDQIILELGSGTGFCGIIAAKFAKRVYITGDF